MDQYWYCGILVKGMETVYSYISDSGEIPTGSYVMEMCIRDRLYADQKKWQQMSLINIAQSGRFSSDNAIKNYANNIWNL